MKKYKLLWVLIPVAIIAMVLIGQYQVEKAYRAAKAAQTSEFERLLSYDEEYALEDDITAYLEQVIELDEDYFSVMVSSGYVRSADSSVDRKTAIRVILDGRLADTEEEAKTLSDGYIAALTLYFGERKIEDYDIYLQIAGSYTLLNGEIIETKDSGTTADSID